MNMNQLKLSFRNVTRQKKRSIMLGLAMGFGVMVSITISALTAGMSNSAVENFSKTMGGHVYISGEIVSDTGRIQSLITDTAALENALLSVNDYVENVNYRSSVRGNVSFGSTSITGMIQGIDFDAETDATDAMTLVDGSFEDVTQGKGVILSNSDARDLNVAAGDSVFIKASTINGQQNLVEWLVGAVIEDSAGIDMTTFYAPLAEVNTLIDIESDQYQKMNFEVNDLNQIDYVRDSIKQVLEQTASLKSSEEESGPMAMMAMMVGGLSGTAVEPWLGTRFDVTNLNDAMSNVMSLVNILQLSSNIVFFIILIIIMVGITNSYRMVLLERVEEIGTMRAMGAQRHWIFTLFVIESLMIALLGSISGVLAALGLMGIVSAIEFDGSSGPMQLFSVANHLQFPLAVDTFAVPILITLAIAVFAVYFPAKAASGMAPGDALRAAA